RLAAGAARLLTGEDRKATLESSISCTRRFRRLGRPSTIAAQRRASAASRDQNSCARACSPFATTARLRPSSSYSQRGTLGSATARRDRDTRRSHKTALGPDVRIVLLLSVEVRHGCTYARRVCAARALPVFVLLLRSEASAVLLRRPVGFFA